MTHLHTPTTAHAPAPAPPTRRRPGPRSLLAAATLGVVLGILAAMIMPASRLGERRSGDPALIADVEAALPARGAFAPGDAGLRSLAVGRIADGETSFASLGSTSPDTTYELGSITKTFTGLLLADAVDRGEMRLADPVSTYLPELAGTPAGASTLRQLATHTSGLPSLPPMGLSATWRELTGQNPYEGWDVHRTLMAATKAEVEGRGHYAYSNLGVSLLGMAEARAAGTPGWATLARERLLAPLGMTHTWFVTEGTPSEPDAAPHRANGWPVSAWSGSGFAPAGVATRTTAADLMRFAQAILDGTAPGLWALEPTTDIGHGERIGLVWMTTTIADHQVVWHNGITGGSHTMIALDPEADRAAVVLGNSSRPVDVLALRALLPQTQALVSSPSANLTSLIFGAVALALVAELALAAFRARSRLDVVRGLLAGMLGVAIALVHGPWGYLPGWLFGLLAGVAAAAATLAILRAIRLPTRPERGLVVASLSILVYAAVLIAVLVTT